LDLKNFSATARFFPLIISYYLAGERHVNDRCLFAGVENEKVRIKEKTSDE
jgi:hypothetical protein